MIAAYCGTPVALSTAEVSPELIDKERKIAAEKAAESGKPAEIVAKMVEGSVQKFLKEVSLLNQTFVKNDKQTVEQMLKEKGTRIHAFTLYVVGEGIEKKTGDFAAEVANARIWAGFHYRNSTRVGTAMGRPCAGDSTLFDASISVDASICASGDSGM